MGWVICSDAVVESCDAILIFMVTASRCICDAVSSHCREILDQCWCSSPLRQPHQFVKSVETIQQRDAEVANLKSKLEKAESEATEFLRDGLKDQMSKLESVYAEAQRIKKQNTELDARVVELNFDIDIEC
ncbi:hypothetical protein Tco_0545147 [Tanacetum coccineum]